MNKTIMTILLANVIYFLTNFSYDQTEKRKNEMGEIKMELMVISDYGSKEEIISNCATPKIIRKTMDSLDWKGFHQVVLSIDEHNFIEVGGSLDPSDGLSVLYEENGEQSVIKKPPETVQEMTDILLSYLAGDRDWKNKYEWD